MSEYLRLIKMQFHNLGLAGNPVPERALMSQVLLGLDEDYNPVVATIQGKSDINWLDMQSIAFI